MTKSTGKIARRRFFTREEVATIRARYPDTSTEQLARELSRPLEAIYRKAFALGLSKSQAYLESPAACRLRRGDNVGAEHRFPPGHVPANKGTRRPGWAAGRMQETQFKKGQWPRNKDPGFYVLGALRTNFDGYIEMRTSFDKGSLGWTALHRILWEDANGPIKKGERLTFKDGDKLNVCLENLAPISAVELMARNTIHRYPPPLKQAIRLVRKVKRKIHEQEHR